ncbi:regulatory protein RecX [Marinobacter sp. 1Y8]
MALGFQSSADDDPEYRTRSLALKLLARREHSRQELSLKLLKRKLPRDLIDTVLDEYEQNGWLDDLRFADIYAHQRMESGYGPLKIESELQRRGIFSRPECMRQVSDRDWMKLALNARRRRFGLTDEALEWEQKVKQGRFLAQRGFTGEQAEQALSTRLGDPDADY